jgi:hypothetical protein
MKNPGINIPGFFILEIDKLNRRFAHSSKSTVSWPWCLSMDVEKDSS